MQRTRRLSIADVDQVVAELVQRYQLAIVTTSRDEDFGLIHGLDDQPNTATTPDVDRHMAFILKRSHYQNSKPDPEPYLLALSRFGIESSQALAIEDSERGLRSEVAAGIDCAVAKYRFADLGELKHFLLA